MDHHELPCCSCIEMHQKGELRGKHIAGHVAFEKGV